MTTICQTPDCTFCSWLDGYNPNHDYKSAHLEWLEKTKSFVPSREVFEHKDADYYTVMKDLYSLDVYLQQWAYVNLMRDMHHHRTITQILITCANKLSEKDKIGGRWFITIGFNHQTYCDKVMMKYMDTLKTFDWVQSLKAKFEIFRTNGEHPHVHMLMETQLTKSKIIEKLMRCKGGSKLILKSSFIDVKPWLPCHDDYLNGIKQDSKMSCCQKDEKYREEHGIPHYYIK